MGLSIHILLIIFCIINLTLLARIWLGTRNLKVLVSKDGIIIDLDVVKFEEYQIQFNKSYSGREYDVRLKNFKTSLSRITVQNALEGATVFGLTKYSDMSVKEFAKSMALYSGELNCTDSFEEDCSGYGQLRNNSEMVMGPDDWTDVPVRIDWRDKKGYVGPIEDQKQCYGCWAFSIAGAMETMLAIQNIGFRQLSTQEILDCSEVNNGCDGGNVAMALDYLCSSRLGIVDRNRYPLDLVDKSCQVPRSINGVKIKSYHHWCNMSEHDMVRQIAHGPLLVIVNHEPWQNYIGGIIWRACIPHIPGQGYSHAVQIVGYDRSGPKPYYIVKNSWGADFGEDGYLRVAIDYNVCGIADDVSVLDVEYKK